MAEITLIEVLDTAVKVGLGALVSGFATYMTTKLGHRKDLEKEVLQKIWNVIEECVLELDRRWRSYLSHLGGAIDALEAGPSDKIKTIFSRYRKQSNDESFETSYSITKLNLIGEKKASQMLTDFSFGIHKFYLLLEKEGVTKEDMFENHDVLLELRDKLTSVLSASFVRTSQA